MTDFTAAKSTELARPYAPSWVNLLTNWIESLPGPAWAAYVVAMAAGILFSATSGSAGAGQQSFAAGAILYYGPCPSPSSR